jgi:hypothetical protein
LRKQSGSAASAVGANYRIVVSHAVVVLDET